MAATAGALLPPRSFPRTASAFLHIPAVSRQHGHAVLRDEPWGMVCVGTNPARRGLPRSLVHHPARLRARLFFQVATDQRNARSSPQRVDDDAVFSMAKRSCSPP